MEIVPDRDLSSYEVARDRKIELLTRLIDIHDLKLGIIFCNTKRMVDDLVEHLRDLYRDLSPQVQL